MWQRLAAGVILLIAVVTFVARKLVLLERYKKNFFVCKAGSIAGTILGLELLDGGIELATLKDPVQYMIDNGYLQWVCTWQNDVGVEECACMVDIGRRIGSGFCILGGLLLLYKTVPALFNDDNKDE